VNSERTRIITTDGVEVESSTSHSNTGSGDLAAQVFDYLDNGASPADIVVRLELPPARVEGLWRTWARLRGHVLLPREAVATWDAALPVYIQMPLPGSASAMVERTRALGDAEPLLCLQCQTQMAEYCSECPGKAAREAAERDASEMPKARRGTKRQ
jgi:hypothetical protein